MTETAQFTPEVFAFLRQLKRHNNREWFARNKTRYEQVVRNPALAFIAEITPQLAKLSRRLPAGSLRGSLFRIYRDVRFSSDKRPFKTHVGIQWTYARNKDAHSPCFYLHLEPEGCFVGGGIWHPDAITLNRIRNAIVSDSMAWKKARRGLDLDGERLSRPPRGFDPAHPLIEDLKCKDYIASLEFTDAKICSAKFTNELVRSCRTLIPLVEFTAAAIGSKAMSGETSE